MTTPNDLEDSSASGDPLQPTGAGSVQPGTTGAPSASGDPLQPTGAGSVQPGTTGAAANPTQAGSSDGGSAGGGPPVAPDRSPGGATVLDTTPITEVIPVGTNNVTELPLAP